LDSDSESFATVQSSSAAQQESSSGDTQSESSRGPLGGSFRLRWCVRALRCAGVVAYPTEAVWGLGCDPWSRSAVDKLLRLKQRSPEQGLIVIAADLRCLLQFVGEPVAEHARVLERAIADSEVPTTWVVPAAREVPRWVRGASPGVALRLTYHPRAAALCRAYGGAIISTSANLAAQRPAISASQVRRCFGYRLDGLLPGRVGALVRPTPIRDLYTGELLRA
jgi:L-threonylcarbamoyladenylate synthase